MADITALAKGLTSIGRSYLGQKAAERQQMNRVVLERMKQDAWLRNLQEQNRKYEITQQRMVDIEKERQKRMSIEADIEAKRDIELKQIEDAYRQDNLALRRREVVAREAESKARIEGKGYYKKTPKPSKIQPPPIDKELDNLIKMRKIYEGEKGEYGEMIGGNKAMLYEIDKRIREISAKKYGFSPMAMEQGYYKQGLVGGGFTEEDASRLTEQRFSKKQPTKKPTPKRESWRDYAK